MHINLRMKHVKGWILDNINIYTCMSAYFSRYLISEAQNSFSATAIGDIRHDLKALFAGLCEICKGSLWCFMA